MLMNYFVVISIHDNNQDPQVETTMARSQSIWYAAATRTNFQHNVNQNICMHKARNRTRQCKSKIYIKKRRKLTHLVEHIHFTSDGTTYNETASILGLTLTSMNTLGTSKPDGEQNCGMQQNHQIPNISRNHKMENVRKKAQDIFPRERKLL